MRVVAGKLGGRQFESPRGHRTHPMSEKVRAALFSALGDIESLTVLDAFAGSGALSIEAVSRGASHAIAIDIDKGAADTIKRNVKSLGIEKLVKAIRANASGWSDNNHAAVFDIVIAAPPYDDLQPTLVQKMTKHTKSKGIFVLDWPGSRELPELDSMKMVANKNYGDAQLAFYRKVS